MLRRLPGALLLSAALLASACASRGAVPRPFPGAAVPEQPAAQELPPDAPSDVVVPDAPPPASDAVAAPAEPPATPVSALLGTALALRGVPYRNAGSDPSGFDCSGFVQYVFAQHGQRLPRETRDQFEQGRPVSRSDLQPGDLVFFETVRPGASHVGIALGNDEFVHAPSSRGVVRVERLTIEYWTKRWVGARRIL